MDWSGVARGDGGDARRVATALAAGMLLILQLGAGPARADGPASAGPPTHFDYLLRFGGNGPGTGEFSARGIAVDPGTGDVYVTDPDVDRVERFDSDGRLLSEFGETAGGGLDQPAGVAVDPASGDVYVFDDGNGRVVRFDAAGAYLGQFGSPGDGPGEFGTSGSVGDGGLAIDPATETLYVADTPHDRVERFTLAGRFLGQFGAAGTGPGALSCPGAIAISADTDDVYVADGPCGHIGILRFTADGSFIETFGDGTALLPSALAVDPTNGNVYVADFYGERVDLLDPEGQLLSDFGQSNVDGGRLEEPVALAIDPRNQDVYVSDSGYVAKFGQTTLRATSTSASCPAIGFSIGVAIDRTITCTATVTDVDPGAAITPTGTVDVSAQGAGPVSGAPCSLSGSGATASCTFEFRPTTLGDIKLVETYSGDNAHTASDDGLFNETLVHAAYETVTTLSCPDVVAVGASATCTARVGAISGPAPSGAISFTRGRGPALPHSPCTLVSVSASASTCSITYSPKTVGLHTIIATYLSDPTHLPSPAAKAIVHGAPGSAASRSTVEPTADRPGSRSIITAAPPGRTRISRAVSLEIREVETVGIEPTSAVA